MPWRCDESETNNANRTHSNIHVAAYTGGLSSKFRHMIALRTDKRVRLMDEIVNGVQVIKMYAWEKPFTKLISEARR